MQLFSVGAPVFLSTTYPNTTRPLQRLLVAQDTGGVIRVAQAGRMRQTGDRWLLWPVKAGVPSNNKP